MILYSIVILTCMAIIIALNSFFGMGASALGASAGYVVFAVVVSVAASIAIDGLLAYFAHRLPARKINPYLKVYAVSNRERRLYERLRIKKWKDCLPDLGKICCGFGKGKIEDPSSCEYLYKYMEECVYGEIAHAVSLFLGFLVLFIFPFKYALYITLPVAFVNFVLNLLPVMALRYNRSKLMILYKRKERTSLAAQSVDNTQSTHSQEQPKAS